MIIERAHGMDGVLRSVEEVFFSKVSGNFPEIFEKSIDKHKIDAILDAPSSRSGLFLGSAGGRVQAGGFSLEESGGHPDTRISMRNVVVSYLAKGTRNGGRALRAGYTGVFFEKC